MRSNSLKEARQMWYRSFTHAAPSVNNPIVTAISLKWNRSRSLQPASNSMPVPNSTRLAERCLFVIDSFSFFVTSMLPEIPTIRNAGNVFWIIHSFDFFTLLQIKLPFSSVRLINFDHFLFANAKKIDTHPCPIAFPSFPPGNRTVTARQCAVK